MSRSPSHCQIHGTHIVEGRGFGARCPYCVPTPLPPLPVDSPYEHMRQERAVSTCLLAAQIPGDMLYDERVVALTKEIEALEVKRLELLAPQIKRFREVFG